MLLGVSRQSVTKWEAMKSQPEMDKLLKMCEIFDCTLDDLVVGDLTGWETPASSVSVPAGPPTDVCGYDEHWRMLAWKVPTGIACILVAVAVGLFIEGADLGIVDTDALFIIIVLSGVVASLAFFVPAGMEHSAFVKAHPFVEDFYTDEDRARARKSFTSGLIAGCAFIVAGIGCLVMLEPMVENIALFFLLFFIALGVWNIAHYGMLLARTDVAEYNRSVAEDLEIEDIMDAQLDEARRDALLERKRRDEKLGAICGVIMIIATIVGLALLFAPVLGTSDPSSFEPEGTSAMWFWVAWPVGGLICGIVSILWEAFVRKE